MRIVNVSMDQPVTYLTATIFFFSWKTSCLGSTNGYPVIFQIMTNKANSSLAKREL